MITVSGDSRSLEFISASLRAKQTINIRDQPRTTAVVPGSTQGKKTKTLECFLWFSFALQLTTSSVL